MKPPTADLELSSRVVYSSRHIQVLEFRAPPSPDGKKQIEIIAALGDYGSGKTFVTADAVLERCTLNGIGEHGFTPERPPLGIMSAPSRGAIIEGPLAEFLGLCPPELVAKKVLYGDDPHVELTNGHRILLRPASLFDPKKEQSGRGPSVCWDWADEIQDKIWKPQTWKNFQARVRDKRAIRPTVFASGQARRGTHVEDYFRKPEGDNRLTVILRMEDNAANTLPGVLENLKASLPSEDLLADSDGWLLGGANCLYARFSDLNLSRGAPGDYELRKHLPASVGVDLRQKAAVVFSQPEVVDVILGPDTVRRERGQMIVDQWMPEDMGAEDIVREMKDRPELKRWPLIPGVSVICLDPTASIDEVNWFTRGFPGVEVVQFKAGPYYDTATGIRATQRAVCDGLGNARLYVHPDLRNDPSRRGVVATMRAYDGGKNHLAHAGDAIRYLTQYRLPLPGFSIGGLGTMAADVQSNRWRV